LSAIDSGFRAPPPTQAIASNDAEPVTLAATDDDGLVIAIAAGADRMGSAERRLPVLR